jgi:archaellum component FlaG (FlaF/FlaG flagellin family)
MLDTLLMALSVPLLAVSGSACAAPAITGAVANELGSNGDLNTYDVAITVKNTGASEPSSVLQSVQVFQDATKVDQKGTPPLAAGASATVHYRLQRSSDARPGSTHLRFSIVMHDPHRPVADCSGSNATYRINV